MNTQKILSPILFALPLFSASLAAASQTAQPAATTQPAAASEVRPSETETPKDVLVRRSVAVGFAENRVLHVALQKRLAASPSGRFAVRDRQQIPTTETGLFVSGFVTSQKPEHGFLDCHARYFVVSQPTLQPLAVESVAASVPIMQVQIFKDRPELLELAAEACSAELAGEIAARLEKLPR